MQWWIRRQRNNGGSYYRFTDEANNDNETNRDTATSNGHLTERKNEWTT